MRHRFLRGVLLSCSAFCVTLAAEAQDDPFAELRVPPPQLADLFADMPAQAEEDLTGTVGRIAESRREQGGAAEAHILLALDAPLTPELRESLARRGIEIIDRFDENIWIARTGTAGAELMAEESTGVAAAAPVPPQAKLDESISLEDPFEWQTDGEAEGLDYAVLFHKGVSAEEAVAALTSVADVEFERPDPAAFQYTRSLVATLTPEELVGVSTLDVVQFIEPEEPPLIPDNQANTQPLSNVDVVQGAPYNLSGAGVTVGVWEAGAVVRPSHQELTPRVTVAAGQTASQSAHALHVAGTIASSGANTSATEGMAPAASMFSWDATNDAVEMSNAAGPGSTTPLVASNHSYGVGIGWNDAGTNFTNNQNLFGSYTATSVGWDALVGGDGVGVTGTELVVMKSAGNHRNDGADNGMPPGDCQQGGFGIDADCLSPRGVAKNVLTVGAMNGPSFIAGFSSFGPTDDGRIKPDLVANGTNVLSLGNNAGGQNDTSTFTTQGTSMSTPAVTGIVALLAEETADQGLAFPSAAAAKAILIQTAIDVAGTGQATPGPDYATGWGIADAQAAVDLLRRPGGPGYAEGTLTATGPGGAWDFPFVVPAGQPEMHVTLAWSDLPGTPAGAGSELVNDLDLRLIPPGGGAGMTPWTLNPAQPGQAAVRNGGDDAINNVEQVSVLTPAAGTWTARVTAKAGSLALGAQRFAVAGPITPDSGPIAGPKADIVMVLDKSGSMILPAATPGLSKMQAMQNAASAFVDYIELIGGHNLGIVSFDSAVVPTSPAVGLGPLDVPAAGDGRTAIGNLSAGGRTAIIDGIGDAAAQLGGGAATNPDDVVFLFSDGRHNEPPGSDVSVIDGLMAGDTRFFSIGYGTDVDSTVMPGVAANHDGVHLEEQGLQAGQLAKLFMVIGGLAADEAIVIDPDYAMEAGEGAAQTVLATKADHSLTFATFWTRPNEEQVALQLFGPNARCRIPMSPHTGLGLRRGLHYVLVRVELPYACTTGIDAVMHEGEWRLAMRNVGPTSDVAKVVVLSDSGIQLRPEIRAKGGKALLTARLVEGGELLRKGVAIRAHVRPNRPSSGDSEKQDAMTGRDAGVGDPQPGRTGGGFTTVPLQAIGVLDAPGGATATLSLRPSGAGSEAAEPSSDGTDPTAPARPSERVALEAGPLVNVNPEVMATLRQRATVLQLSPEILAQLQGRFTLPLQPTGILLRDDGTNGDAQPNDGIFSAMVATPQPLLHQVRFVATQARPEGQLTREALASFLVQ